MTTRNRLGAGGRWLSGGRSAGIGAALTLALGGCETNESLLDQSIEDNPACVGSEGYALGDTPPVFTLTDIQYTLGVLGQLQIAVTPFVQAFLPPEPLFTGNWTNWSSKYIDIASSHRGR